MPQDEKQISLSSETVEKPETIADNKESPVERRQEMLAMVNDELGTRSSAEKSIDEIRSQKEADITAQVQEAEITLNHSINAESRAQIMENNVEMPMRHVTVARERTAELERQKDILEYVGRELPETETRIAEPMRPECRVSVSIPAYEEGSGILQSLEFLADQDGISKDQYEIIVNVNNRANANKKTLESNGRTLNVLKFL